MFRVTFEGGGDGVEWYVGERERGRDGKKQGPHGL